MGETWTEFLSTVDQERDRLGLEEGEECFFRGHSENNWDLTPTLLRHCKAHGMESLPKIRALEAALYFEFRSRARELHDQSASEWDILFSMRHHGVATRLLDWTETLGVAVYFALRDVKESSQPCVWLLNPYALNEKSRETRDLVAPEYLPKNDYEFSDYLVDCGKRIDFDWEVPVALYPLQRNARLHAQRGFFTIHGIDVRPLDQIVPGLEIDPIPLRRVMLLPEAWEDARQFLRHAGIDEFLMFPDLDGLARHLHMKHDVG